jgi:hypothetical protein
MVNGIRKVRFIILVVMILTAGLTACEYFGIYFGGIINVENKRPENLYVHITDSDGYRDGVDYTKGSFVGIIYSSEDQYRRSYREFKVTKNGTYWVYVNGIRYKNVSVNDGDEVHVTID